jgi:hypothetical protein
MFHRCALFKTVLGKMSTQPAGTGMTIAQKDGQKRQPMAIAEKRYTLICANGKN